MRKISLFLALSLITTAPSLSSAVVGPLIFNTGMDALNGRVADGTPDLHYTGFGPSGTPSVVPVSASPGEDGLSAWIQPTDIGPGSYGLGTSFTLDAAEPITIKGRWAAASAGFDIAINGVSGGTNTIGGQGIAPDFAWHDFTVSGAGLQGSNSLEFLIYHPDFGSPLGLRVEITSVALPEPGAAGAAAAAIGLLLGRRRR